MTTTLDKYCEYVVEDNEVEAIEQMGSKPKFWFSPSKNLDGRWLYKAARPGTGDDWSEKIASELALLLGLPCARVELGIHSRNKGIISNKFHPKGSSLIHGNEMLSEMNPNYSQGEPTLNKHSLKEHTIDVVFQAFEQFQVGPPTGWVSVNGISSAADMFTGYLLLDAWIGNTDRHHENWACVRFADGSRVLAPTYDHAASMGALLRDEERKRRLLTKDKNYTVEAYASKALSALRANREDAKFMLTHDAFRLAARSRPSAAKAWLNRIADVPNGSIEDVVSRLPENRITLSAMQFAKKLLEINRGKLLRLKEELA